MGMYTEIYVNVDLIETVPANVIAVLKAMCRDGNEDDLKPFPARWAYLFNSGSYYTPNTSCANLTFDDISKQWSLLGKGDIKNYENEIEQFFAWIAPYVDAEPGAFIGYSRYEQALVPTLHLKPEHAPVPQA